MAAIREDVKSMVDARKEGNSISDIRKKAKAYSTEVVPFLETIRYHVDKLELIVDDELWPFPKYREMLFTR